MIHKTYNEENKNQILYSFDTLVRMSECHEALLFSTFCSIWFALQFQFISDIVPFQFVASDVLVAIDYQFLILDIGNTDSGQNRTKKNWSRCHINKLIIYIYLLSFYYTYIWVHACVKWWHTYKELWRVFRLFDLPRQRWLMVDLSSNIHERLKSRSNCDRIAT